jgi:hypothetical protein
MGEWSRSPRLRPLTLRKDHTLGGTKGRERRSRSIHKGQLPGEDILRGRAKENHGDK